MSESLFRGLLLLLLALLTGALFYIGNGLDRLAENGRYVDAGSSGMSLDTRTGEMCTIAGGYSTGRCLRRFRPDTMTSRRDSAH